MIKHGANMLKFQVKDLLDRSLLENQIWEPNLTEHNLNSKIEEIVEIMKVQASHKNILLKYHATSDCNA